jgi:hypothetical protein
MISLLRPEFMVDLPLEKAWQQLARLLVKMAAAAG